jgi:peptide/nickel transport system permease protein
MNPTTNPKLKHATDLIRAGKKHQARMILAKFIKEYPASEHAWHILSYAVNDQDQQVYALNRTLEINPKNKFARQRLAKITPKPSIPSKTEPNPGSLIPPRQSPQKKLSILQQATAASTSVEPLQPIQALAQPIVQPATAIPGTETSFPNYEIRQADRKYSLLQHLITRLTINWRRFMLSWRIFAQSPLAIFGLILIVFFGLMAVAHPILMNTIWSRNVYDPATGFDTKVFPHPSPPVSGHILGTDSLGRDVLSMILAATTPTFVVGLTAALTTAIIGSMLSVIAAYFRGRIDAIITNMADVFLLFPAPVIMVIIGARFRDLTPLQLGLIYGLVTGAGGTTIVMRAQAIQIASKPFMEAAHVSGGGPWHIITKHLVPSVMPLAALQMMIAVTGAVVADGFISFFGLTRRVSNWGTIIYDAFVYGNISGDYGPPWHMLIPSAACFSLFALGFYLVSRGLHRVASPTLREDI